MYDKHLCCAIVSTVITKYYDKGFEIIKENHQCKLNKYTLYQQYAIYD